LFGSGSDSTIFRLKNLDFGQGLIYLRLNYPYITLSGLIVTHTHKSPHSWSLEHSTLFWKKGKKVIVVEGYSDLTQVDESFLSKNLVMVFAEKDLSQASESFLRPKSYYDLR
jgi:hypothetical protein